MILTMSNSLFTFLFFVWIIKKRYISVLLTSTYLKLFRQKIGYLPPISCFYYYRKFHRKISLTVDTNVWKLNSSSRVSNTCPKLNISFEEYYASGVIKFDKKLWYNISGFLTDLYLLVLPTFFKWNKLMNLTLCESMSIIKSQQFLYQDDKNRWILCLRSKDK